MKPYVTGLFIPGLIFALFFTAQAQVTVEVGNVDVSNFPTITAEVTTKDAGAVVKVSDNAMYSIMEDGFEQSPLTVDCPVGNNVLHIAFVIGNGQGHTPGDVAQARAIATEIVEQFDGVADIGRVSLYAFQPPFCGEDKTDKVDLKDRISNIVPSTEPNSLYDIMLDCGSKIPDGGGMVLFTNGQDNASQSTFQDVDSYLRSRGITLYLFHMGSGSPAQNLVDLVHATGGKVSTELTDPANDIVRALRGTPDYCLVSYESTNACRDGNDRNLNVEVEYQSETANTDKTFAIAADAGTNQDVTFTVEGGSITSGASGQVTVSFPETIAGQYLYTGSLQLNYDTNKLTAESATGANALAENSNFDVTENGSGAVVSWTGVSDISGTGDLFYVTFTGGAASQSETVPVTISDVNISRGCLNVATAGGDVELLPKSAALTLTVNTLTFDYDGSSMSYDPAIQAVKGTIRNTGDVPVTNVTATLDLPVELKFAAGSSENGVVDKTSLAVDEVANAIWYIKPQPQVKEVTAQATASANCDEGGTDTKTVYVNIKAADGGNRMFCEIDEVTVENGAYTPDPTTARVTLWGVGTQGGPAGECKIIVPAELTYSGGSTRTYPALNNGLSNSMAWPIEFPTNPDPQTYQIMFVTQGAEVNPDTCIVEFTVPGLTVATFETPCIEAVNNVNYNNTTHAYEPDPFAVSSYVKNTGTEDSDTIWAELELPAELMYAGNDMMRKMVSAALTPGDSMDVSWDVAVNLPDCEAHTLTMTYRVYHGETMVHECTKVVRVAKRDNEDPVIESKDPNPIGTVAAGVPVRFQVTVSDADGDPLTYVWKINDVVVTTDSTTSYTHTFMTGEQFNVTCEVTDFCGAFTFAFWTFTPTSTGETPEFVSGYAITGNYPNPFNPSTTIEYRIPDGEHHITMELLDTNGKLVKKLLNETTVGGTHRYELNAGNLPSGSYIVRLASGSISVTRTIMLVK